QSCWGTDCGGGDCATIVWGSVDLDNIVWGSISRGDNIVWGSVDLDNSVWGSAGDVENVLWDSTFGDTFIWGNSATGQTWSAGSGDLPTWVTDEQIFSELVAIPNLDVLTTTGPGSSTTLEWDAMSPVVMGTLTPLTVPG